MRKLLFLTIQNPSLQKLCDVGIQCSHQPLTLKSTAIQTEFEDATMSTRVSTVWIFVQFVLIPGNL